MDENEDPRPSTSKQDQDKSSHKNSNGSSNSSMSKSHSEHSHDTEQMGHERPKVPKQAKNERKHKIRKDRRRPAARVLKRSRRPDKKRPTRVRRSKRISDSKKKRELSISTIFSRLSSSVSMPQPCPRCGHRCCQRRSYEKRRYRMRRLRNFRKKDKLQTSGSMYNACIQAGSRCLMLSPLCINTNATPSEQLIEKERACEITPEMIHEALRRLTMWRQEVNTATILNYIKRSYPVGPSEKLLSELTEKLRIAVIAEIVTQTSEDCWCLSCALQKRKLTKNHVTLFWKIYGDTMKPVIRKPDTPRATGQDRTSNTVEERIDETLPNITYDFI